MICMVKYVNYGKINQENKGKHIGIYETSDIKKFNFLYKQNLYAESKISVKK